MRTIIRLQRQGPKNAFYYRLVAQGHYKKLSGKFLEHLGTWFPEKINAQGRAVLLNKNRIRYWLSVGALLSHKMQRFLSFANMTPEPWAKFGRATIYKDPVKTEALKLEGVRAYWGDLKRFKGNDRAYQQMKIADHENLELRRIKFQQRVKDYLDTENKEELVQQILREPDKELENFSIFVRTQKFRVLKQFYEDLLVRAPLLSPLKRELLYQKMNRLAEAGLLSEEDFEAETKRLASSVQEAIDLQLLNKYEGRKQRLEKTISYFEGLMAPLGEADFVRMVKTQHPGSLVDIDQRLAQYLRTLKQSGQALRLLDVERFAALQKLERTQSGGLRYQHASGVGRKVASRFPLTPMPNLHEYDPNDWYDLTEFRGNRIGNTFDRNDQWFYAPLSEERKKKEDRERATYWKSILKPEERMPDIHDPDVVREMQAETPQTFMEKGWTRTKKYLENQKKRRKRKNKKEAKKE